MKVSYLMKNSSKYRNRIQTKPTDHELNQFKTLGNANVRLTTAKQLPKSNLLMSGFIKVTRVATVYSYVFILAAECRSRQPALVSHQMLRHLKRNDSLGNRKSDTKQM